MRKTLMWFLPVLMALLICANTPPAEGDGFIQPHYEFEIYPVEGYYISEPYPWLVDPSTIRYGYPEVKYHHVHVNVTENFAVTEVDQEFYNPYGWTLEGTYIFPIPEGAVISDFELIINGVVHRPEIMDSKRAAEFLEEAVRDNRDASLLEYSERNLFTYKVSIPSKESRKICLRYEEVCPLENGLYRYIYTLGTERYSSALIPHVSLDIRFRSGDGIETVYSPTHEINVIRENSKNVRVKYEVFNGRPDKDIEIYYSKSRGEYGAGLMSHSTDDEGHFMFLFTPDISGLEDRTIPKDVMIVLDRSGSMGSGKLSQAKSAISQILDELTAEDRFNIIMFNDRILRYSEVMEQATHKGTTSADTWVRRRDAGGGTNIDGALQEAFFVLNRSPNHGSLRVIIFLTDGEATIGTTDTPGILERITAANQRGGGTTRIFAIGVGHQVNTRLLDGMSGGNRGETSYVREQHDVKDALGTIYHNLAAPIMIDISLEFEGIEVFDMLPETIPDIFKGTQLTLTGRFTGSGRVIARVEGLTANGPAKYRYSFDLDGSDQYEFVPRIWATRRMGVLLERIRDEGETMELREEVTSLGLKYGLITPYTSMYIEQPVQTQRFLSLSSRNAYFEDSGIMAVDLATDIHTFKVSTVAYHGLANNMVQAGGRTFMVLEERYIETSLLPQSVMDDTGPLITGEWINRQVSVDRFVLFGSDRYFLLRSKADIRDILSLGNDITFTIGNEVIRVSDEIAAVTHGELIEGTPGEASGSGPWSQGSGGNEGGQITPEEPGFGEEWSGDEQGPMLTSPVSSEEAVPGEWQPPTDDMSDQYSSHPISSLTSNRETTVQAFEAGYLLTVSLIVLISLFLLWTLWVREGVRLGNISSMRSLRMHIRSFASEQELVLALLQRMFAMGRTYAVPGDNFG